MYFQLIFEAIKMAILELIGNKLRTFLSLLGITIGIFCIISILAVISSFEKQIQDSISKLGNEVLYIGRWPWENDPNAEWWEYFKRPYASMSDYEYLKKNVTSAEAVSFAHEYNVNEIKYGSNSLTLVNLLACSYELDEMFQLEFEQGRYMTEKEAVIGEPIIILGAKIAEELFTNSANPIGKQVKADGRKYTVIGILEKEGESIMGSGFDENVIIPVNQFKKFVSLSGIKSDPMLNIKAKPNVSLEQLKSDVTRSLRMSRRLKPKEKDNFAINQISMLNTLIDGLFKIVNLAGAAIGFFSLIVGGFGIANIMFVSVRERTKIIGIKKSIGATKFSLLLEFLVEAVILCILGGLVGLLSVLILIKILPFFLGDVSLSLSNNIIYLGIALSIGIGIISGLIPALMAAYMNPVDAIRTN